MNVNDSAESTEYTAPDELDCRHEPAPRCPFCGYIRDGMPCWQLSRLRDDDDTTEVDCDNCERPYKVTLHIEYTYTTELTAPKLVEAGSK